MRHVFKLAAGVFAASASLAQNVTMTKAQFESLRNQAQTARDVEEIQNLMSRRAMYHSIGHNEDELALWSQRSEVRWAQNQGCWVGMASLKNYYVTTNYAMQKNDLKRLSESNPAIENDYTKNRNIGTNVYHILTTPIIEVAQDGNTAKGFWYTPGAILSTQDGKTANGMTMWEKYGVDFIREDGQWRFLHIEVMTDFAVPFGAPLPDHQGPPAAAMGKEGKDAQGSPGLGAAGLNVPGPNIPKRLYTEYSPTRVPQQIPRLPEPYTTLSKTFEYADCGAAEAGAQHNYTKISGNPDMSPMVTEVDTNHDGKMSRAEWEAAGLPISSFNMFEKGRGYVTQEDYETHAAPPGIDINGDGKVTEAEFKAFDKMMSAKMANMLKGGSGGPPPPSDTPAH